MSGRETSLVRAKHAALRFSGGPAGFPRLPPSATHWHQFKPRRHRRWLRSHTNAPCHRHPTAAEVTGVDPERAHGSRRERQETHREFGVRQRAEGELRLGKECGPAQPRGPTLIAANFSSTKQVWETSQFPLSFMPQL